MRRRNRLTRVAIIASTMAILSSGSCGIFPFEACTDDLSWRVSPTEATLKVGEAITAKAEAFGCGGTEPLEEDIRWTSEDPSVATVGETTGRITGRGPGSTTIAGEDLGPYGIGPVSIPVAVEQ